MNFKRTWLGMGGELKALFSHSPRLIVPCRTMKISYEV